MSDQESSLPSTWVETLLGQVIAYGSTEKAEPDAITNDTWVLELEDIEKDTSRVLARLTFAERRSKSTKNRFETGDVLYGKLRPYLNKIVIADRPGVCTTEILPLKPNEAINGSYLFYWLKHPTFLDYVKAVSYGVNMPRLGTESGKDAPFVLAPLPEQKRIADKLDAVLARVDACRDSLNRVPLILKRFRQSVLAAATSGQLTADWRAQQVETIPISRSDEDRLTTCGWKLVSLSKVCQSITDGDHQAPPQATNGIPFITISAINDGQLRLEKASRYVPREYFDQLKSTRKPASGDVLFSVTGSICIPALVSDELEFTFQRHIAILRPNLNEITSKYLYFVLGSEHIKKQGLEVATGTAQLTVSLNGLRCFQIQQPPISEQHEIVRRVETLFAFADRLEARLATARAATERLTPALLAKAFRGELVPQDPDDEPAAALLQRLAASRAEAGTKPRRARAAKV